MIESRTGTPWKSRASSRASSGPVLNPEMSTQARLTGPPRRAAWRRMARASSGTPYRAVTGTRLARFSEKAEVSDRMRR